MKRYIDTARKGYSRLANFLSYKRVAVILTLLFVLSMIPVIYVGLFDYANGDDLLYGAPLRRVLVNNGSIVEFVRTLFIDVIDEYNSFQGTWSAGILFRLEPSIWFEKAYILTPFIAYFCLLFCPGYFLHEVIIRILNLRKEVFWTVFPAFSLFLIQYMQRFNSGLYWYTGMVLYTVSFGMTMLSFSFALQFLRTSKISYFVSCLLTMFYLGGGGYPEVVLAVMGYLVIFIAIICGKFGLEKKNYLLFIPFIIELIGFAFSAAAPGNSVRGGSAFGFSIQNVLLTIIESIFLGAKNDLLYLIHFRPLFLYFILLFILIYETIDVNNKLILFNHPIIVSVLMILTSCSVHAPEIYAGKNVVAGFSGGVYNSYYFTFLLCYSLLVIYDIGWLKKKYSNKLARTWLFNTDKMAERLRIPFLIFAILFCICFGKHLVGNSLDYICINYISSGELADFDFQMKERLAILSDDNNLDVIVPMMNYEQGPLMHMALTVDPNCYTNWATARFYGKNSIVAIERPKYYEKYGHPIVEKRF